MGKSLVYKILEEHLVSGTLAPGQEIGIRIDQTLTQDATGTMAYLQFEAMGVPRVKTKLSVSYIDHNMLQASFENADDHRFLQSIAAKYGIYFSRPGNGICHQVHLERFAAPGETLLGSDSHTPTSGGMGMVAIGAGGLDVAVAMAGGPFHLIMPRVVLVLLKGVLHPWVSAKDIILYLQGTLTVKGGVGKIFEYGGEGIQSLTVPERATITNMGAELGATTSVFPSDHLTKEYLVAQGRGEIWRSLEADAEACKEPEKHYQEVIDLDLSALEPMIARPHSPDNACRVSEVAGIRVNQVCVGSCTNSSYKDLRIVAEILKGRRVHPDVSMTVTPGSKQVFEEIARDGSLTEMIAAGARILESACGPCIGMGQAPPTNGVSVRTFNRNFEGRSGTPSAQVYLASPAVAAATAVTGVITDPRDLGKPVEVRLPERFHVDDSLILPPAKNPDSVAVERGPNIKPLPKGTPLPEALRGRVLLKVGDNITTDHIMPAGARVLPLRSNIPAISEFVFERVDPSFVSRMKESGGGFVVGGSNYGQGSSREHAALAPMFLGLKMVLARSFARIHRTNLVNFGILPLTLESSDYEAIEQGDELEVEGVRIAPKGDEERCSLPDALRASGGTVLVRSLSKGKAFHVIHDLTEREAEILIAGGLLNYTVGAVPSS